MNHDVPLITRAYKQSKYIDHTCIKLDDIILKYFLTVTFPDPHYHLAPPKPKMVPLPMVLARLCEYSFR